MAKKLISLLVLLAIPLLVSAQENPLIYPWYGLPELGYHFLPVGGWNVLGAYSPRSTAMGETMLANVSPQAGYLNPAALSFLDSPCASLGYRLARNLYKVGVPDIIPLRERGNGWGWETTRTFDRNTDALDGAGIAFPLGRWALAANYFLFQEFNFPTIDCGYWWLQKIEQTGGLKGVNLAVSHRFSSAFSIGLGASYVFGSVDRTQNTAPYFILMNEQTGEPTVQRPGQIVPPWPWIYTETYELDMKGILFNVGITFEPSDAWRLGLLVRPAYSLDIEFDMRAFNPFVVPVGPWWTQRGDFYARFPFLTQASIVFKPEPQFSFAADVSYVRWNDFSTDYSVYYGSAFNFRDTIKLNIGGEYLVRLPFRPLEGLALRAGYIYDPQPYAFVDRYVHEFACFGIGLNARNLRLEAAAKLRLHAVEKERFQANILQVGLSYDFK